MMAFLTGPWTMLVLGGLLEMVWAIGFKYVKADAPLALKAGVVAALIGSMALLFAAMRHLPAGTAYAVWTGIGAVSVVAVGILVFKEPATMARLAFLALILIGIIGVRMTSSSD